MKITVEKRIWNKTEGSTVSLKTRCIGNDRIRIGPDHLIEFFERPALPGDFFDDLCKELVKLDVVRCTRPVINNRRYRIGFFCRVKNNSSQEAIKD